MQLTCQSSSSAQRILLPAVRVHSCRSYTGHKPCVTIGNDFLSNDLRIINCGTVSSRSTTFSRRDRCVIVNNTPNQQE